MKNEIKNFFKIVGFYKEMKNRQNCILRRKSNSNPSLVPESIFKKNFFDIYCCDSTLTPTVVYYNLKKIKDH